MRHNEFTFDVTNCRPRLFSPPCEYLPALREHTFGRIFRVPIESPLMRKIMMITMVSSLALPMAPVDVWAQKCTIGSTPVTLSASETLLKMIRNPPVQTVCADPGSSCSRDDDCCPGNFCAGESAARRICMRI